MTDKSKPMGINPIAKSLSYTANESTKIFPVALDIWKNAPRDNVALAIQKILNEAGENPKTFNGNVTWVFQGYTSPEVEAATKRGLINGITLYTKLGFKTTNALVFNARDMTWLKSQLTEYGCKYGALGEYAGFYVAQTCIDGNGANTARHYDTENQREGLEGILFNHILSHEYFHQLQDQYSKGIGYGRTPLWFWEGGAQFFTLLAYSSWNKDRFYEQWFDHWFDNLWGGKSACGSVNVYELEDISYGPDRHCGYSKGSLIVELFVSSYGVVGYQKILSEMSMPDTTFSQAFQKVTSTDLISFYSSAQVFLKSRGWDQ
jgi:hypothetical protein